MDLTLLRMISTGSLSAFSAGATNGVLGPLVAPTSVRPARAQAPPQPEPGGHRSDNGSRAATESELERARRHYLLAREEARAERDAAIAAANRAAEQAIERIEGRYREIDGAFNDEETERILEMLRRPSGDGAP